jgi:hypothetical protein
LIDQGASLDIRNKWHKTQAEIGLGGIIELVPRDFEEVKELTAKLTPSGQATMCILMMKTNSDDLKMLSNLF